MPCIANPAVISILEQELDLQLSLIAERETADDQAAGRRIGRRVMARYPSISPARFIARSRPLSVVGYMRPFISSLTIAIDWR